MAFPYCTPPQPSCDVIDSVFMMCNSEILCMQVGHYHADSENATDKKSLTQEIAQLLTDPLSELAERCGLEMRLIY